MKKTSYVEIQFHPLTTPPQDLDESLPPLPLSVDKEPDFCMGSKARLNEFLRVTLLSRDQTGVRV